MRGMKVNRARSYSELEHVAARIRGLLAPGLEPDERFPAGVGLFERLGSHEVHAGARRIGLAYAVVDLPPGSCAFARYDARTDEIVVTLSTATYTAVEDGDARARFSLCHELGHVFLHGVELLRLSEIPHFEAVLARRQAPEHPVYLDSEWQADSFAAAVLMPAAGIAALARSRTVSAKLLANHFGASHEAAKYRLTTYADRKDALLKAAR